MICWLIPFLHSRWHFRLDDLQCFNALFCQNDRRGPQLYCFLTFFYRVHPRDDSLSLALEKCVLSPIVWKPGSLANDQVTASNTGTCLYIVWTALGCLNQFINAVIWNKNTVNRAPVWCDICEDLSYMTPYQSNIDACFVPGSDPNHHRSLSCHTGCVTLHHASPLPNNNSAINEFIESRSRTNMLICMDCCLITLYLLALETSYNHHRPRYRAGPSTARYDFP